MSRTLYGRRLVLTVGDSAGSAVRIESSAEAGLRVTFKVAKNPRAKDPNTCEVQIHNLSESTRARLDPLNFPKVPIRLEAGYDDQIGLVFAGESTTIAHARTSTGWVTTVSTSDGQKANEAHVNKSFAPGAKKREVFGHLLDLLAESAGIDATAARERLKRNDYTGFAKEFFKGYVASGSVTDVGDRLARDMGLRLSIQDGEVQLLAADETAPTEAVELGPETGLVGSPEVVRDEKRKGELILKGKALLSPRLFPGARILLNSVVVQANFPQIGPPGPRPQAGAFKLGSVDHQGDTHGGEWITSWEALTL